jgi:uridylate kinase
MKKVVVLSLGGSLIIPEEIDYNYLKAFKKIILKNSKKYVFIIVCGGGSIARKYIGALEKDKANEIFQSFAGISSTRTNARFISYLFRLDPKKGIPHRIKEVKEYLKKQNIVVCGALEYHPNRTSDSTAADLAKEFKGIFINLTNIKGIYTDNPLTNKNAKFIEKISWKEFYKMATKRKFKPGQHFVLDQHASRIIMKNKIKTYILGKDIKQLYNLLNNRKFIGSTIEN